MRAILVAMSWSAMLPGLVVSLVATHAQAAEDFTGFYAGVNAGYAFGRDGGARSPDLSALSSGAKGDDRALPPSALQASESMKAARARPMPSAPLR